MTMIKIQTRDKFLILGLLLLLFVGCMPATKAVPVVPVEEKALSDGLTQTQIKALDSLAKVDDYPLYTMHYWGATADRSAISGDEIRAPRWGTGRIPALTNSSKAGWGCSLFATLWQGDSLLYGRNFDWRYSPALLLFVHPDEGFASVSMVDLDYLIDADQVGVLLKQPLAERKALLKAPVWPFDGMNERGLVVGMAAVPESEMPYDPDKDTVDSLFIMRLILDQAANVEQAVEIIENYNLTWGGGPALHYLIADRSGTAVLVEFYEGKMIVIPNEHPWHQATNHLRSTAAQGASGCWRYEDISQQMAQEDGRISNLQAMELLSEVSWGSQHDGTQWSVVYDMEQLQVHLAMGRQYEHVHIFALP
jgi:hypothetical protein